MCQAGAGVRKWKLAHYGATVKAPPESPRKGHDLRASAAFWGSPQEVPPCWLLLERPKKPHSQRTITLGRTRAPHPALRPRLPPRATLQSLWAYTSPVRSAWLLDLWCSTCGATAPCLPASSPRRSHAPAWRRETRGGLGWSACQGPPCRSRLAAGLSAARPLPSVSVTTWRAAKGPKDSRAPLGQSTSSRSTRDVAPRPKCSRASSTE